MTLPTGPDHLLSLDESDALPEDPTLRRELEDGVVVATGPGSPSYELTLPRWDSVLKPNCRFYELEDGLVRAAPLPPSGHRFVAQDLAVAMDRALRPRWRALTGIEVTITSDEPATVRVPDVIVVRPVALDCRARQDPFDVLAVAEVLRDGSQGVDRISKPAEYAEVGIGCYLIVEPGPPTTITELRLCGDAYERVAEHSGTANLTLDGSDVVVDLQGMLRP